MLALRSLSRFVCVCARGLHHHLLFLFFFFCFFGVYFPLIDSQKLRTTRRSEPESESSLSLSRRPSSQCPCSLVSEKLLSHQLELFAAVAQRMGTTVCTTAAVAMMLTALPFSSLG